MKMIKQTLLFMTLVISSSLAQAEPGVICEVDEFVKNQWVVNINEDDASEKAGILEALDLLSTRGFSIQLSQLPSAPYKNIYVSFNPKAYNSYDPRGAARKAKLNVLKSLSQIPGVKVYCVTLAELHEDEATGVIVD